MTAKKLTSYVLSIVILIITLIAILGIWGVIDLDNVMKKVFSSLIVIFASSLVTLFIFNVLVKDK